MNDFITGESTIKLWDVWQRIAHAKWAQGFCFLCHGVVMARR